MILVSLKFFFGSNAINGRPTRTHLPTQSHKRKHAEQHVRIQPNTRMETKWSISNTPPPYIIHRKCKAPITATTHLRHDQISDDSLNAIDGKYQRRVQVTGMLGFEEAFASAEASGAKLAASKLPA